MREIKFRYRVRAEDDGRVITYFKTLKEIEAGLIVLNHRDFKILSRDEYTGLKDRNREEIYEEDIVRDKNRSYKVTFDKGYFRAIFAGGSYSLWAEGTDNKTNMEIIGNIYNNPELLK